MYFLFYANFTEVPAILNLKYLIDEKSVFTNNYI